MQERTDTGLTLLELLIVVALLSIIAAFAVPRLLRARSAANEASAIASLKAVAVAEDLYAKFCGGGGYAATLPVLGQAPPGSASPFLPPDLSGSNNPQKAGYRFSLAPGAGAGGGVPDCHGLPTSTRFYAAAVPQSLGVTGRRAFAVATSHTVWQQPGAAAPVEPFSAPATPIQ